MSTLQIVVLVLPNAYSVALIDFSSFRMACIFPIKSYLVFILVNPYPGETQTKRRHYYLYSFTFTSLKTEEVDVFILMSFLGHGFM